MQTIALIACCASKNSCACKAKDMYISPLFKGSYAYAKKLGAEKIYILSAKHGLLDENKVIEPYNETLLHKSKQQLMTWANNVYSELVKVADVGNDKFIILAGAVYRKYLIQHLCNYIIPMESVGSIGKQLAFLKQANASEK